MFLENLVAAGGPASVCPDTGIISLPNSSLTLSEAEGQELIQRDLASRVDKTLLVATAAGRAWVSRRSAKAQGNPYRLQHGEVVQAEEIAIGAQLELAESPLLWLRRRKDAGGQPLIGDAMFAAGERLRADFTYGSMAPKLSVNWDASGVSGGGKGPADLSDSALAARQRVQRAMEWVGPELSGVLLDVCCFLKRLEDVERDRRWPARSAKTILGLALGKLARHYGYQDVAIGVERRKAG